MEDTLYLLKQPEKNYKDCYFSFCGFSKTEAGHSFGPAVKDCFLVHIILEGEGSYSIKDQTYSLKAGQGFIIPPGVSSFYQADQHFPWTYLWMGIGGEKVQEYFQQMGIGGEHFSFHVQSPYDFKALIFECFAYDDDTLVNELNLQKKAYDFLQLLAKSISPYQYITSSQKMNPYVQKALQIINQEGGQGLSITNLAKRLAVHPSYLSRLFKANLGLSTKDYIYQIRINMASDLLVTTSYSIEKISQLTGFSSIQNFSKAFKKIKKVTPSAYRKKQVGFKGKRPEE